MLVLFVFAGRGLFAVQVLFVFEELLALMTVSRFCIVLILGPSCQHLHSSTTFNNIQGRKTDHELRFLPLLAAMDPATPAATTASTEKMQNVTLQKTTILEGTPVCCF